MLITKEQQEALLEDYIKRNSHDACIGFIDGMNAIIELMLRLELSKVERLKNKC
jgi:hypothetical protein